MAIVLVAVHIRTHRIVPMTVHFICVHRDFAIIGMEINDWEDSTAKTVSPRRELVR